MKSDLGLVGCKLGPIYQNVDPLGPEFLRVCEALERLELPMLIHQGTTFARAGSLLQARPILLDEIALRYPKLKIVIAHIGHPWFDEAIAVVRRHPHVYADISALVTRRWLLYQALVSAIEYRVEHKLLFGTDFPFFSAQADDRRPALGHRHGLRADMPVIDEQVVEDIIHRPTLELLEITRPPRTGRTEHRCQTRARPSLHVLHRCCSDCRSACDADGGGYGLRRSTAATISAARRPRRRRSGGG